MDEIDFTLDGTRYHLTRLAVIKAMAKQTPGRIQTYAVDIAGQRFPVKQVLAQALQVPVTSFISTRAQDLLAKLGFEVINVEEKGAPPPSRAKVKNEERALSLAVELHARRRDARAEDVLATADLFADWLGR